jgi:hypothetical protein
MDGDREARPERGLDSFINLVCKLRDRNRHAFRVSAPTRTGLEVRTDLISNRRSPLCERDRGRRRVHGNGCGEARHAYVPVRKLRSRPRRNGNDLNLTRPLLHLSPVFI